MASQLQKPQMPSAGHGVSALSFSKVRVKGLRVEGAGHPVLSLHTKKSVNSRTGSPKTVAKAPGLRRVVLALDTRVDDEIGCELTGRQIRTCVFAVP